MALGIKLLFTNVHRVNYITGSLRTFSLTITNMDKAIENLKTNPYFDKYASRIADLQKTSPEEFLQRVEQQQKAKEEGKKKKFAAVDTRQFSSALNPKEPLKDVSEMQEKKLNDILKLDLVQDKDAGEIQSLWQEYHKDKHVISASIPRDVYMTLQDNIKQFPTFLFPLPRDQGYEFIMCQSFGHSVHFTPLLAYQVHKENAPECLTVTHYTELLDKGIVLMRGEYDKNVLNGEEARCLANQFQLYYCGRDEAKVRLLDTFTRRPDSFRHTDLIAQLENIGLA